MILAFLLQLNGAVRPVIGPRNADQLRQMWRGADVELDANTTQRIAAAVGMSDFLAP
jgi:aryl-alcohol dehydrogenase-like predicted oxidoreductase